MKKNTGIFKNSMLITSAFYLCVFAVTFFIVRCAPLLTDDYMFLSRSASTLKAAMLESLHYGNGRVLGNFLSLYFVQHQTVMDIERSLIITLLIAFLPKIIKNKENSFLYSSVSSVLVLGMSPLIFSEVFSWASGFHNYVPPVLLTIICFVLIRLDEKTSFGRIMCCAAIAVLGAASQLFLELSTLVNICFAVFLIVYFFVKNRHKLLKAVIWFASTAAGGALMLIVPKFFVPSGATSNDSYRKIHLDSISEMLSSVANNSYVSLYILSRCEIVFIFLSVLLLIVLKKYKDNWKNQKFNKICSASAAASALFFFINCIIKNYTVYTKIEIPHELISAAFILLFLIVFVISVLHLPTSDSKTAVIACMVFAVFPVVPMLIITPFGYRCMFISYIFISAAALILLDYVIKDISHDKIRQISKASAIAFVVLASCLALTFSDIYWLDTQQMSYIEAKLKEKPSEIEVLNFESDYIYTGRTWGMAFCYYNEKQFDIEFKDLPFEEWYANRRAEGWY